MKVFTIFIVSTFLFFFGFLFLFIEGLERSILSEDYYKTMAKETSFSEHVFDDFKARLPQEIEGDRVASVIDLSEKKAEK